MNLGESVHRGPGAARDYDDIAARDPDDRVP